MAAKSASIKGAGGKFGGCALKAVSLIAGGLSHVPESELRGGDSPISAKITIDD